MKGSAHDGVVDWLQFRAADVKGIDTEWNVNLTFLLSGWECIYGRGCPGHFGVTDRYVAPDIACCSDGFYTSDEEDLANVELRISQLTDADWDQKNRAFVEKAGGWSYKKRGDLGVKSRTMEGGCVFANRSDGSTGKPGCAFVALANRLGENVDDATIDGHDSHTKYMPGICHEVPLRFEMENIFEPEDAEDYEGPQTIWVDAWDAGAWTAGDKTREQDDWMAWWCVDAPEAYRNELSLFVRMKDTLVARMGQETYDYLAELIARKQPKVDPMPGAVVNGGRPLLPLFVSGREPKRPDQNFKDHIESMRSD